MQFNEYANLAQRTSNTNIELDKLINGCLGLAGESGEVLDIIKKALYQGHKMDIEKIAEELGDVLWYIAEICAALGVDMDEVAERNIAKLMTRYPDGFDEERSIHREDE